MIRVKKVIIGDIPLIELVLEEKDDSRLPMVVVYHGWTSNKEAILVNGYELAKRGMRALLPEAFLHGERAESDNTLENNQIFWKIVERTIIELPTIYDYYNEKGLSDSKRFGVSGISMGGIICCALLTKYEWIKSAVILMGSPSPIKFTNWLFQSKWVINSDVNDMPNKDQINSSLEKLRSIDLSELPEMIANRSVHFWHGTKDKSVPFHLTEDFIEKISLYPYAENVSFSVGHGHEHKVPYAVSVEMAEYFENKL